MDAVLSNVVGPIISKLVELAITPIGRQFGYMFCYSCNLDNLRKGVDVLRRSKSRVDALVAEAKRMGNLIPEEVQIWLTAVAELNEHVESLFNQQVQCLDLKLRFQLSKKAYKMKINVDNLQTEGRMFTKDNVSYPAPPPKFSAIFPGDTMPFRLRDSIRDEILEALKKDDVKVLGLYGMGGVGKTTLIQEVAKRAEEKNIFDEILMAVVSQDPSIRKIQDQFASKLGLSCDEVWKSDTDSVRAGRLHEKLEKTGKVLVILDDLWKHLDLEAVGIPSPDKHKCCKIVITTRRKDVCDQMDCKNNTFSIMSLSEEEGWHLFKKMAGDCVTSAEVKPVAIEVAKECGGLPLAIVVVARALKDKSPTRWKDALRQLRASAPTNIEGVQIDVYSRLQLSYDYLDGEEIKHFFLLFSLYPEDDDVFVEYQIRYGVGLGLFHQGGLGNTMQEAREKADSFVDILKSACLLLDGNNEGTVRVHDVVRDFCISSIASKGQKHVFLVKLGWEFTEWPEIDCSANYTAISFFNNEIKQFPRGLNCPKLKVLLFSGEQQEVNIIDSFFEKTKELAVLDITGVHIPLLPSSLGLLGKLRTLCLDDCTLGEMEIIGNLKGLEVLSMRCSRFKDNRLPMGISLLTRLRLLDLSDCRDLMIPYGILSNLSRLEELYLAGILSNLSRLEELYLAERFDKWEKESEDEIYIENSRRRERYASLSELKSSSHSLTTLMGMHVKDASLFPKDLFFPKLTTFRIQIGDDSDDDENYSHLKAGLTVDFKGSSIPKDHGIFSFMKRCEYLQLSQMGNKTSILYEFIRDVKTLLVKKSDNIEEIIISEEGEAIFPQLKYLGLHGLPKLASFCNVRESRKPIQSQSLFTDKVIFPYLEELRLEGLDEVGNIWHSELPNQSFQQLKELRVFSCEQVLKIVPAYMHPRLQKLQKLEVLWCASVEEIFEQQDHSTATGGGPYPYPHLTSLDLRELPRLTHAPLNAFLNLESLTKLKVEGCNSLTSLSQPSMAKRLVNLEELDVTSCEEMQEIFGEEEEEETKNDIVFPKVKTIRLFGLYKLTSFIKEDYQLKWQKCQNATCKNNGGGIEPIAPTSRNNLCCPRFQALFNPKVVFSSLEELRLDGLHEVENIWHSKLPNESFLQLKELTVYYCNSLTSLSQPSMAKRLVNLVRLEVNSCKKMKEIVGEEEEGETEKVIVFPKVQFLCLSDLPKLTCFRKGDYQLKWQNCKNTASINGGGGTEAIASTSQSKLGCPLFQPLFNHKVVFPSLEKLRLDGLHEVENIWHSKLPNESFLQLKELTVSHCNSLKSLFQPSIAKHLVNLEKLHVLSCEKMKEIVGEEEEKETEKVIVFPKVKILSLRWLSELTSFRTRDYQLDQQKCKNAASKGSGGGTEAIASTSQSKLGCPLFQPLFNHKVAFPSLTEMSLDSLNGIKQIWGSQYPIKSFPQLKILEVHICNALEAVIGKQGEEEEISRGNLVIPQLMRLTLSYLQNIRCFCENNLYTLEFPSLDDMALLGCPKMITFSYASATAPKLEGICKEYGYIPLNKDINTTLNDIFLEQEEEDKMASTSEEGEEEEMVSTIMEEEGEEKDEIKNDGSGSSEFQASVEWNLNMF